MENYNNNYDNEGLKNNEVSEQPTGITTLADLKLNLLSIKDKLSEMSKNKDNVSKKDFVDARIREKELRIEIKKMECTQYCKKLRCEIVKLTNELANDKKRELERIIKSNDIDMDALINAAKNM